MCVYAVRLGSDPIFAILGQFLKDGLLRKAQKWGFQRIKFLRTFENKSFFYINIHKEGLNSFLALCVQADTSQTKIGYQLIVFPVCDHQPPFEPSLFFLGLLKCHFSSVFSSFGVFREKKGKAKKEVGTRTFFFLFWKVQVEVRWPQIT